MPLLSKIIHSCLSVGIGLLLMSADMHLQTSVDRQDQQLRVQLDKEVIAVYLDGPGVHFEKSPEGYLTYLSFFRMNTLVKIWFHRKISPKDKEIPKLIQRFQLAEGKWLLSGPVQEFNRYGEVLSEAHWMEGKLHGPFKVFSKHLVLREERSYDENFPVGHWKTFYDDGTLAGESFFPKDKKEWEQTWHPGFADMEQSLFSMDFINPFQGREIWYSEAGYKQKEQALLCFYDGHRFQIKEGDNSSFSNNYGQLIREESVRLGERTERSDFTELGTRYRETQYWKNGALFKRESTTVPSHQ